jgi:hypothetical protein
VCDSRSEVEQGNDHQVDEQQRARDARVEEVDQGRNVSARGGRERPSPENELGELPDEWLVIAVTDRRQRVAAVKVWVEFGGDEEDEAVEEVGVGDLPDRGEAHGSDHPRDENGRE